MRKNLWWLVILIILPLAFTTSPFIISIFVLIGIYTIAASGMDLLTAWAGQISIGNAAFFAVGAYASTILVVNYSIPFPLSFLIAGIFAGALGLIIGLPALRLSGFYLAIATMSFGVAVQQIIGVLNITGGYRGIRNIPSMEIFNLKATTSISQYYIVLIIILVISLIFHSISKSKTGLSFIAMRDSDIAARAFGINLLKYKLMSFIVSAVLTGFAGSLYASVIGFISPSDFGLTLSLNLLAMIVIGGMGSVFGSTLGATFFVGLPFLIGNSGISLTIVQGVLLITVLLFLPRGLAYEIKRLVGHLWRSPSTFFIRRKPKMFVEIDGKRINYETCGDGKPIVYVHGNFASHHWFDEVMDINGFKTYALDLPNFGDSDRIEKISIDTYAEYLWKFIRTLKIKNPILIGHSLGGAVALKCAIDHSKELSALMLVDPAPANGLKTPEQNYPILESLKRRADLLERSLMGIMPTKRGAAKHLTKEALKMKPEAFTENAKALEKYDYSGGLSDLELPVNILFGTLDPIVPRVALEDMAKRIPNAKLKIIEGVGHSLMIEDTKKFKEIVEDFSHAIS